MTTPSKPLRYYMTMLLSLAWLVTLMVSSCTKDELLTTKRYTVFEPVYESAENMRKPFMAEGSKGIEKPGKIYIYDKYLLINDRLKGIHVIDNSNPASPQRIAFLNIPGNVDMAVRNNYLYADSYMDMLVLDISDPASPSQVKRVEDAWPEKFPFEEGKGYVVDYLEKEVIETSEEEMSQGGWQPMLGGNGRMVDTWVNSEGFIALSGSAEASSFGGGQTKTGIGGSMARFTISGQHLYIIDYQKIYSYNIMDPASPEKKGERIIGWEIETIFPAKGHLFIGTPTGMMVFSLDNPDLPVYRSGFSHARGCDPVVVEGNTAYVTVRSGGPCGGAANTLSVVDITDLSSPRHIKTYQMKNPRGLGVDNGTLFLCDGKDGLKVFNAADPENIDKNQLGTYDGMETYDVIPYNNILILTSTRGIFQYDYSNPSDLKLLSTLFAN